jgi:hypothetical protein
MAIALVASDATTFAVSTSPTVYNFPAGAPGVNDLDILTVNSDATINTPAGGWQLRRSEITNQGAYVFSRKGGSGTSVSITTPAGGGPFNSVLSWSRWSGTDTFDVSAGAQVNSSAGTTTPAISTGPLAQTGELVLMLGALHGFAGASPTTPSWSSGYNPLGTASQGSGASGTACFVGYKLNAGTAAETPTVSWANAVTDRYALAVTFTADSASSTVQPDSITLTTALGQPALSTIISPDSVTTTVLLGQPSVSGAPSPGQNDLVPALYAQALQCLCDATAANPGTPALCVPRVGTSVVFDVGQYEDLCCQGISYIMLGDMYISATSFPEQDIVQQIRGQCAPPTWAVDFKLGIVRCISAGQPNGDPPLETDQILAARQNLYDAQSLRAASCCFRNWLAVQYGTLYDGMNVVINRQVQGDPQGGCVERYVTLTVQFPDIDCGCS